MRLRGSICLLLIFAASSFAKESTDKPYAGSTQAPLAPAEAQKKFKVPEGFEVRLFAAEPDVANPVAMTFDEKGRLWVVELYEYPNGAKPGTKGRDRVKVYQDTNNDGVADKVSVFCDGLSLATAILVGNGGVYVGQAPDLYFYPIIEDGAEGPKAGPRKTVLNGFGLHDRHELLNSFAWGPDGWLYMTQGVFTQSLVKDPENPNDPGVKMNATVARYNTTTKKFELFADGISNQWGVDWDAAGNAFVSACVVEHIWHIAPGGVYIRQGGQPTIPFTYELLKPINKDKHRHHMAAYGGINVYQGNLFPEEYRGTVFMGNIHGNCIDHDKLTADGAGFSASDMRKKTDDGEWLEANDDWFRPVSQQVGPDGALWIMDWYDRYPCYQNSQAPDLDRTRGRIWRVVYTGNEKGKNIPINPSGDLAALNDGQLVELLSHPNVWQRRQAQRLLTERKTKAADQLSALLQDGKSLESRLAALWTLYTSANLDEKTLDALSTDQNATIRAWSARLTGERGESNQNQIARLTKLASDPDPIVRSFVAYAARRFANPAVVPIVATLLKQPDTEKDPVLPFLIWMAAESNIANDPNLVLDTIQSANAIPPAALQFTRKSFRRIADTRDAEKMNQAIAILTSLESRPSLASAAIDGLLDIKQPTLPATDPEPILTRLQQHKDKDLADRATRLAAAWGSAKAATALLKVINDPQASEEDRIRAIRAARDFKTDDARSTLLSALSSSASERLKLELIRTLNELGSNEAADQIMKDWKTFSPDTRRAVAEIMATRVPWATKLLQGYESKLVAPTDIPLTAVRAISRQKDKSLLALLAKTVGPFRETPTEKAKLIAAKKQTVLNGPVDLNAGHALAAKTCLVCHTFYNEGGTVGPDLTGVGRSSLDALLTNVIDPNQIIGKGYENTIVETKDDRLVTGRLVEDTDDHVKLLAQGPKEEIIARKDIKKIRTEEISVMPEGLENMPEADFRNLMWYILNPPQDQKLKKVAMEIRDQRLLIKGKAPGSENLQPLLAYTIDPARCPSLHVRDMSGQIALTGDSGIFLSLSSLNDSPAQSTGRFKELLDLSESADHITWRAKVGWKLADGTIVDDVQTFTAHSPQSPGLYLIDIERTLTPRNKPLQLKSGDPTGLVTHFKSEPENLTVLNGAADWNANFDGQSWGISILEHPTSFAYPSQGLSDDKFFVAAPFLKKEGKLQPDQPTTFLYRLAIHKDKWTRDRIEQEQSRFSSERP
jgi:putative membrane-bound dehydrogenase-like protein